MDKEEAQEMYNYLVHGYPWVASTLTTLARQLCSLHKRKI